MKEEIIKNKQEIKQKKKRMKSHIKIGKRISKYERLNKDGGD